MDAFIYRAALLCPACDRQIRHEIAMAERNQGGSRELGQPEDSDQYPQGPYPEGGGEADSPSHCDNCNRFLENPLTGQGVLYVQAAADRDLDKQCFISKTVQEWLTFYDIRGPGLEEAEELAAVRTSLVFGVGEDMEQHRLAAERRRRAHLKNGTAFVKLLRQLVDDGFRVSALPEERLPKGAAIEPELLENLLVGFETYEFEGLLEMEFPPKFCARGQTGMVYIGYTPEIAVRR